MLIPFRSSINVCVYRLHLFGGQPMVICKITCIGQGPVLSVIPEHLNFGHVKLLEDTCKIVSIYNDSPIGAAVTLQVIIYIIHPPSHLIINL